MDRFTAETIGKVIGLTTAARDFCRGNRSVRTQRQSVARGIISERKKRRFISEYYTGRRAPLFEIIPVIDTRLYPNVPAFGSERIIIAAYSVVIRSTIIVASARRNKLTENDGFSLIRETSPLPPGGSRRFFGSALA